MTSCRKVQQLIQYKQTRAIWWYPIWSMLLWTKNMNSMLVEHSSKSVNLSYFKNIFAYASMEVSLEFHLSNRSHLHLAQWCPASTPNQMWQPQCRWNIEKAESLTMDRATPWLLFLNCSLIFTWFGSFLIFTNKSVTSRMFPFSQIFPHRFTHNSPRPQQMALSLPPWYQNHFHPRSWFPANLWVTSSYWGTITYLWRNPTNGKRKLMFKSAFGWGYVSSREGITYRKLKLILGWFFWRYPGYLFDKSSSP